MKARKYIVANEGQELDVLGKLEEQGFKWIDNVSPLESLPSKEAFTKFDFDFPYTIVAYEDKTIIWSLYSEDDKNRTVFDGRKEDKMIKKYKVTQEFMDKLVEWRDKYSLDATSGELLSYVAPKDLGSLPSEVETWWYSVSNSMERNNHLMAIISWLNGDDSVFEEPNKFIIRSEKPNWDGEYWYVLFKEGMMNTTTHLSNATKFSSREKASEWANSHQVVIEVDAEGNEV